MAFVTQIHMMAPRRPRGPRRELLEIQVVSVCSEHVGV